MNLSADERTTNLKQILRRENGALAEFVIELAAFDRDKLYLELGYRSLWDFCKRELGLSERATYYRIAAARQLQTNPVLVEQVREGTLCITTLAMLSKVMTDENSSVLIEEATGKSTRQVEQIVARLDPKPVPRDIVREVTVEPSAPKVETKVLTETLLRKYFTVDREYEDLLAAARAELSHSLPQGDEVEVLKEGLRRIVRDGEKRKGLVEKPRKDREATDGAIPKSVKRAVWKRDGGCCQWRTADGQVCGSKHQVEFHHRQDRAKGGLGSVDNVMLLCRVHNQYAAEISCGSEYMNMIRRARRAEPRCIESRDKPATETLQSRLDFSEPQ